MSSIRKIERREHAAYQAMVRAQSELIAAQTTRRGLEMLGHHAALDQIGLSERAVEKLRRRAGAYRAQWVAAARLLEETVTAREVEPW